MKAKKAHKRRQPVKEFRAQPYSLDAGYVNGIPMPETLVDMVDAYQLHPWVYAAVYAIASNFASIDFTIYQKGKTGEQDKPDLKNPFVSLLERPNPFMTPYELKEMIGISLEMTGNAYLGLERDPKSGEPIEMWPLPTHMVQAVASKTVPIDHYIFQVNAKFIRYEYSDMIHLQNVNPKSGTYGQGSILAARTEITADMFAATYNKNFFKNSARPDAVLETDKELPQETRMRIIKAWKQMHNGVANAHKMAILEGGTKYKEVQRNQHDMQFQEQRKASREMILAVFGVPPSIVGVLEFANYANIKEQNQMFWKYTMLPKIRRVQSTLTMRVQQITFSPGIYVKADTHTVEALRPDLMALSQITEKFVNVGVPLNRVIEALELPFESVEGGDVPRAVPVPGAGAAPAGSGADAGTAQKEASNKPKPKALEYKKKNVTRETIWKKFSDELDKREGVMKSDVSVYFKAQQRRVKENLAKNGSAILAGKVSKANETIAINLLFDENDERKKMEGVVARPISKAFFDFAKEAAKKVDPNFDFNLADPFAVDWVNHKKIKVSREVNQHTLETLSEAVVTAIEDALREGYDQGETIKQISDRIDEVYDFAVNGRADRIARTEIISATNAGSKEGMKKAGAEEKEWLATQDEKTRESHADADGQIVGMNEAFQVGNSKLDFPGDPSAEPGEIINCRCTLLPVIPEDSSGSGD